MNFAYLTRGIKSDYNKMYGNFILKFVIIENLFYINTFCWKHRVNKSEMPPGSVIGSVYKFAPENRHPSVFHRVEST